jgi:hypothetical protein
MLIIPQIPKLTFDAPGVSGRVKAPLHRRADVVAVGQHFRQVLRAQDVPQRGRCEQLGRLGGICRWIP